MMVIMLRHLRPTQPGLGSKASQAEGKGLGASESMDCSRNRRLSVVEEEGNGEVT